MKYRYYIGIDPGVHTGLSIWDGESKAFLTIDSLPIHKAMQELEAFQQQHYQEGVYVRFEDARQRKWFGNAGREQLQGAGSIKRDCGIWEIYLKDSGFDFEMVAPKNNRTKVSADGFQRLTGWKKRTNEHSRDSAMLVFQFSKPWINVKAA